MMPSHKDENHEKDENALKACNDAIVAVEYIVYELRQSKAKDLANILNDVIQVYKQVEKIADEDVDLNTHNSILYFYFIQKYYNNIKANSYKNKVLDFFKNEINKGK